MSEGYFHLSCVYLRCFITFYHGKSPLNHHVIFSKNQTSKSKLCDSGRHPDWRKISGSQLKNPTMSQRTLSWNTPRKIFIDCFFQPKFFYQLARNSKKSKNSGGDWQPGWGVDPTTDVCVFNIFFILPLHHQSRLWFQLVFIVSPRSLRRWSKLTSIFFKWGGSTTH